MLLITPAALLECPLTNSNPLASRSARRDPLLGLGGKGVFIRPNVFAGIARAEEGTQFFFGFRESAPERLGETLWATIADTPEQLIERGGQILTAIGPERTFHMSHLTSLSGVKRTWVGALHMSAFDPKRTSAA